MSSLLTSTLRRQAPSVFRRHGSTSTSEASAKAQATATAAAAKAGETLSSISNKVGPAAMSTLAAVGKIGGPVGRLVKGIESLIPPTLRAARTGLELSRIVFHARGMSPPSISTFEASFKSFIRNPPSIPSVEVLRARLTDRAALTNGAVIVGEVLGFFTVGEMIGRRKIVGYRGKVEGAHH